MKSMINTAPESLETARSEGLYELIALSRHYQPRVRRYALAILENSRLPPESASDRQVLAEPFEKLSFLMLLDVWNRMRRTQPKTAKADSDESDADEPKNDFKKTDNAQVAASLYEMDEYRFISKFVAEKDEIAAKEQAAREKLLAKRKSEDLEDLESDINEDSEDSDVDDAELEAEADAIMQQAIKKHASSAFGNEEDDDDFAYEAEDSDSDSDDIEGDFEDVDTENPEDDSDDNEDYDALFVDSDAENIELLSGDDEDASEEELEQPVTKKSKKQEPQKQEQGKKQKKQKKSVFAAASDYEDALQD